jgi:hypothetical protein
MRTLCLLVAIAALTFGYVSALASRYVVVTDDGAIKVANEPP